MLLRNLLLDHFGALPLEDLVVARQEFPLWMRADVQGEIECFFAALGGHRFSGARLRGNVSFRFPNLIEEGADAPAAGPAVWSALDLGDAEPVRCLLRGLWLAKESGRPFGLLFELDDDSNYGRRPRVEIATLPGDDPEHFAAIVLKRLREAGVAARSLRGKALTPTRISGNVIFPDSQPEFRVQAIAPVAREEMVLAPGVLELIERNTLGFAAHADALARLGMGVRKGILLYGPPGTGKTLVVRYLAGALGQYTKFILGAHQMEFLGEAVDAAKLLQPAMVVIEDVDLIGADRDGPWQNSPPLLNHLLDEMDGLGPDARVLFVLTSNRADILEPALAGRPGRIDQAVEIGLPEDRERRVLLARYARGLGLAEETAAALSKRIGKVSPAFIKELCRRAAQEMLELGANALADRDFERSLQDLRARPKGLSPIREKVGFTG